MRQIAPFKLAFVLICILALFITSGCTYQLSGVDQYHRTLNVGENVFTVNCKNCTITINTYVNGVGQEGYEPVVIKDGVQQDTAWNYGFKDGGSFVINAKRPFVTTANNYVVTFTVSTTEGGTVIDSE